LIGKKVQFIYYVSQRPQKFAPPMAQIFDGAAVTFFAHHSRSRKKANFSPPGAVCFCTTHLISFLRSRWRKFLMELLSHLLAIWCKGGGGGLKFVFFLDPKMVPFMPGQ